MTPLAAYVLIAMLWAYLRGSWTVFCTVVAIGWAIKLWQRRRQLLALFRAARATDDPVPEWMEEKR